MKVFNYRIKRKKRGSLSLSINAIVVLILAMSMLGLGIAFTKNMFGKLAGQIKVPPPPIDATSGEPVVISGEVEFRHGKEFAFSANFYNDFNDGMVYPSLRCFQKFATIDKASNPKAQGVGTVHTSNDLTTPRGGCHEVAADADNECSVITAPQSIPAGEQGTFSFIIPKAATKGTEMVGQDVCEIAFCVGQDWYIEGKNYKCPNTLADSGGADVAKKGDSISKQLVVKIT